MPMVADVVDAVVGVDTHRDTHSAQIAFPTGVPIGEVAVANDTAGYGELIDWAVRHAPGRRLVFAVEGTRSYGIGLARALHAAGLPVVEVVRPARAADRRGRGKTDAIDAHLAVLAVLRMDADRLPTPRADGDREALRILLDARQEMTTTRTRHINRLKALLGSGDDTDRALGRAAVNTTTLTTLTRRRDRAGDDTATRTRRAETRRLARAIHVLTADLAANERELTTLIRAHAPTLLSAPGIGPVSAAQAIVSYSHPGRIRSEAAFAALAGAAPIPASSGQTTRYRLNRGGDRALNRALHTIATNRMINDPRTHAYTTKRRNQGKTTRDIRRCLKRYIARELFRELTTTMT